MQKLFKCKDIGNNCRYEVSGNSEEEVLQRVRGHARTAHNMEEISEELANKVHAAIYTWF
jgi:predicted small metal-binding protein